MINISMKTNEAGFTIAELITTIIVFGIVAVVISNLVLSNQSIQRKTAMLESATRAAQREVESLRNNNYNTLTAGQTINFTNELPDNLPSSKSGTVVVSEPSPGLKRVDVTVSYNDGSKDREVKLSSLIGVIGIAQ